MADLVAKHAGQFGFGIEVGENSPCDVDVSAGQREGIDLRAVDDRETVLQIGSVAVWRKPLAHLIHVFL